MKNKQIKFWLMLFVLTLAVAGAASSWWAQKKTFYRGLDSLETIAKASVLSVKPAESATAAPVTAAPVQTIEPVEEIIQETPVAAQNISLSCPEGEIPIIKNSKIDRCEKQNSQAEPATANPSVSEDINPASCESQGRFTYTGEDQPGLLYGMCIDCLTTEFVQRGGSCS